MYMSPSLYITKGSSSGATLSFALRSKGEGGQPRYLIIQEIASHFSTPPHPRVAGNNWYNAIVLLEGMLQTKWKALCLDHSNTTKIYSPHVV